jgi:hypothetical protein
MSAGHPPSMQHAPPIAARGCRRFGDVVERQAARIGLTVWIDSRSGPMPGARQSRACANLVSLDSGVANVHRWSRQGWCGLSASPWPGHANPPTHLTSCCRRRPKVLEAREGSTVLYDQDRHSWPVGTLQLFPRDQSLAPTDSPALSRTRLPLGSISYTALCTPTRKEGVSTRLPQGCDSKGFGDWGTTAVYKDGPRNLATMK